MSFRIFFVLVSLFPGLLLAQKGASKTELLKLLKSAKADTVLLDTYNELVWPIYSYIDSDSSAFFAEKAKTLAKQLKDFKRLSITYRRIGITYINTGEIKKAILNQEESYRLSDSIGFKKGMQLALNNIGVAYLNNELYNKALEYFLKSLGIAEAIHDSTSVSPLYSNCAMIYRRINDYPRARDYFLKARSFAKLQNDRDALAMVNFNLSATHRNMDDLDSALYYSTLGKTYVDARTSESILYTYYLNEGLLNSYRNKHAEALQAFETSTAYVTNPHDQVTVLINIGEEYKKLDEPIKMNKAFEKAFDLSLANNMYNNLQYLSQVNAAYYKSKKDYKKYSEWIEKQMAYRDSNDKYTRVQQIQHQQLEFDFERKHIADSLKFEQREKLKNAELQVADEKLSRERSFKVMLMVVLVIIAVFSVFIFNRFVITRRQKKIIENQKRLVEHKNSEIVDSINYARRLQAAILPQVSAIEKELEFGLFYLPKDIIGGDFYFYEKLGDFVFMAVCDCTGHGIPGALMSVVCHQALRKSIAEFDYHEPDKILEQTRTLIIQSLNASEQRIQDGMDCSLLVLNTNQRTFQWAGANNPLWLINSKGLEEIKADKQPVALYEKAGPFTGHSQIPEKNTLVYLFTDGYADQFGGEHGKKFKLKQLKTLLLSISHLPVKQQVAALEKHFQTWKGQQEQVDDVSIAIIRL